jgi:AraC-like DNA-binding protein
MDWIQSLTKAIHYIENRLTCKLNVDEVADNVYTSSSHFQRIFNLVTGMTVGDYIRNRRLSMAGQDFLHPKNKIIDVAMKYQYDTQESFSKAFTRFHGVNPSNARKQQSELKNFRQLSINIIIKGGFEMSRKLIDHLPIHQLQYPNKGQNYVFNGCMKFLMECIGEDEQYDYWFFSAISGDAFVQVFGTDKEKWTVCFSQAKFDYDLIKRVFDAIGYNFTYLSDDEWRRDKEKCKAKLIEYINKGVTIIGKGFYQTNKKGVIQPYDEVSCIVGYENDGECFYRLPEEATNLIPFTLNDERPYTFVFIEEKKSIPPIAEVYKNALFNVPRLMATPPSDGVYFGNAAFEKWAECIEGGHYKIPENKFDSWKHYCIYVCILATNAGTKRNSVMRILEMNPELNEIAPLLINEFQAFDKLGKELNELKGGFDINYETLQNDEKCKEIAQVLRKYPEVYTRICNILV